MASVEEFLEEQIHSGALKPGGRVPTERALATLLGRSRHDIRRQLDKLESQGRVTREVGRGTFLTEPADHDTVTVRPPVNLSPLDLIDARAAWEPNLMTLVAVAATAEDFAEIRRCMENGEAARSPEEFLVWDMAFHRALAMAAHNTVVGALNEMVEIGRRQLAGSGLDKSRYTIENCAVCQGEHRDIANAIFDRDPVASQTAMRKHLQTVRRQMLSGLP
ncbi:GntR family transcriptional regulator [Mycolicibacterium murale]|uniref:GntR family transcriptional regulator n=1 Tax=Mycolicibacterium murale TaxID=182220 RepID=A0A7I9WVN9_9MYCO|nr:FCD domain-containing protein [Mycolicibacterium murale]MCV7185635.1 FadR family transcriptional regulator [Mycolicibacterium murale]GFG61755.1 GntR family transcriptional regulator [Mycolicibacterium murale]